MAREFKQITGTITKINAPYFAEKRNVWVMMVKTNENWVAINSRNEVKIKQYHHYILSTLLLHILAAVYTCSLRN